MTPDWSKIEQRVAAVFGDDDYARRMIGSVRREIEHPGPVRAEELRRYTVVPRSGNRAARRRADALDRKAAR